MATVQDILLVLESPDNDAKVKVLQAFLKKPEAATDPDILKRIEILCRDTETSISFWARKLYTKISTLSPPPPPQETAAEAVESSLSIDLLFQKLQAVKSSYVAIDVIKKILDSGAPSAKQALVAYLENCNDVIVVSFLVKNLGIYFPDEETLTIIGKYLKSEDDRTVANAIEGLENIPSPKTTAYIAQVLEHKSHRVKANAAKALAKQDPAVSSKMITHMLTMRERPHFVIAAMYAVKALKDKRFLGTLQELASDPVIGDTALEVIDFLEGRTPRSLTVASVEPKPQPAPRRNPVPETPSAQTQENIVEIEAQPSFLDPIFQTLNHAKKSFMEGFMPLFLPIWRWFFRIGGIAVAALILIALIGGASFVTPAITSLKSKIWKETPEWCRNIPTEQKEFIQALEEIKETYISTTNDLKKATYYDVRKDKIKNILKNELTFNDWIGVVEKVEYGEGGSGIIEIRLKAPTMNILVGNWIFTGVPLNLKPDEAKTPKEMLKDLAKKLQKPVTIKDYLIDKKSSLFRSLLDLEVGHPVKISGNFVRNDEFITFIVRGAEAQEITKEAWEQTISEPNCVVRFTDIRKP